MKIEKTKHGTWTTRVAVADQDGNRHWKRFTASTKPAVREAANNYLTRHKVYVESEIFSDALVRFVDAAVGTLSPSTVRGYTTYKKVLLRDYSGFCSIPCDRITSKDVQKLINKMRQNGRSPKTIRNYIGLVSAVLTDNDIQMPLYNAPQATVPLLNIPDEETITKVASACVGQYERMRVPLGLAVFGLRRGEICGATADDLDGEVLHVRRVHVIDQDGIEHVKEYPKNEQSIRSILLPAELADQLRTQGCAWDGTLAALTCSWPHLCKSAGVEYFRLHDCRHFFVSYCHDVLHLSDAQIMKAGGWKTDSVMKRRYRHAITDGSESIVSGIGSLIQ